jgi:DNA-binding NarL/FixJ family response regulator
MVVRAGVRLLLESHPGLAVVGEASNSVEALALVTREQPDILLLAPSADLPLDVLPELLAAAPETRVLALVDVHDPELRRRAVCLGALGLVSKHKPPDVLFQAIEKVHAGEAWLDRRLLASVHREMTRGSGGRDAESAARRPESLTGREREVAGLVAEGLKNKQIAARLYITEATVRHHLTSIFGKLGVVDRLGFAVHVYRHGRVRPEQ